MPPFFEALSHVHLGPAMVGSVLYLHGAIQPSDLGTMAAELAPIAVADTPDRPPTSVAHRKNPP